MKKKSREEIKNYSLPMEFRKFYVHIFVSFAVSFKNGKTHHVQPHEYRFILARFGTWAVKA